ncbi:hypothetical protein [Neiella litorisoli]|nr:hypothetical protein [Neiella litorisoli]
MSKLVSEIEERLSSTFLSDAFPIFSQHGLQDTDVMVHSLGCSLWNTLGHELGYMALVEGPAPVASGNDIRSDSVWFEKSTCSPKVLVEFERYDGSAKTAGKLREKLCNLMEAAMRWEYQPKLIVLSAWSPGLVSAPDLDELKNLFCKGVNNSKGLFIPPSIGCQLLLHRLVLDKAHDDLLYLKHQSFNLVES